MKKIATFLTVIFSLATTALAEAQTVTPAATPTGIDLAGSSVAAVAVIIVFAFIVYAGYRIIRKWSGPSKGESD